jgi:hypothetical protein
MIIAGLSFLLVGCASTSSEYYSSVQHANEQRAKVEIARAEAELERLKALQSFAYSDDGSSSTAAVMALALTGSDSSSSRGADQSDMVSPRKPEIALRWASVLVPSLTNLYGINRNTAVDMQQIDRNAAVNMQRIEADRDMSMHDNETMLGFGRLSAGKEAPIVGDSDDVLLYPRNPADEVIVGTEDDQLIYPTQ